MKCSKHVALVGSIGALFMPLLAQAEPRALIVGIGEYQLPKSDLPGIDIDVDNMRDLTQLMGFKPEQVRVLLNKEATLERVTREMSTWLRDGVKTDDPVLFYFSGHGTRITDLDGDEDDKADEVLVMHDSNWGRSATSGPNVTLQKSLVDDKIAELVSKIPSQRVLLLIDACNSGTATRNIPFADQSLGQREGVSKFLYYPQMPKGEGSVVRNESVAANNFAALSAAGDTESAIATDQGGVFTLGLVQAIRAAAKDKRDISVANLKTEVSAFIVKRLQPSLRFTPVTTGKAELVDGTLDILPLENANGPIWRELHQLASKGNKLAATTNLAQYRLGQEVELKIDATRGGYLNVITVDSSDSATVLFPNKFHPTNEIKAGTFKFPTAQMPFVMPAVEPTGKALIVAFVTDVPVNALELGFEGRDSTGRFTETFTEPTKYATRGIGIAARSAPYAAATIEVEIKP
jgi:metacaspase-1